MKPLLIICFIAILFSFSCASYKEVPYFQNVTRDSSFNEKINNYTPLTLQQGDLVAISVTSLNHEADMVFNYNLMGQPEIERSGNPVAVGYLIDQEGNINVPIIGLTKASGYTTKQIATQLEAKLQTYLSKPVVNVRILNFKISVLGDVKTPGNYNIQNERITVTQALGLAGDLNTTAMRKNVLLIRENAGNRKYINIDLTSKAIFNSPYYYLKNNDVIYAQPNNAKVQTEAGSFAKLGVIISAASLLVYAFTLYITRN